MKDIRAFISVSVEKELPKEANKYYHTDEGVLYFSNNDRWYMGAIEMTPDYWLKPFSLPELMEEYTKYLRDWNSNTTHGRTDNTLVNDFLKQQGII